MKKQRPMYKHEDSRRILVEVIKDESVRSVKMIYAKEDDCTLGNHHHDKKDESFYLVSGGGWCEIGGTQKTLEIGELYRVPKGIKHTFVLDKDSIMLGLASEPFDPEDEICD